MSRFNTLLRREWMQHQRGWLVMMLLPPALILLLVLFGRMEASPMQPLELMLAATFAVPLAVLGIALVALGFQIPSLARRDRQDRSIEFWLSLPASHAASIGAPVLMHALLVPWLALVVGALASQAIGLAAVAKVFGPAAWSGLPWGTLLAVGAAALLRALFGVLLASFWLMPFVLLTMAASAWLKRWGIPVLVIGLNIAHVWLARVHGIGVIGETARALLHNAGRAMVNELPAERGPFAAGEIASRLADAPRWLLLDAVGAVRDLAQPLFVFAIVASAVGFGLLVLRRQRAG